MDSGVLGLLAFAAGGPSDSTDTSTTTTTSISTSTSTSSSSSSNCSSYNWSYSITSAPEEIAPGETMTMGIDVYDCPYGTTGSTTEKFYYSDTSYISSYFSDLAGTATIEPTIGHQEISISISPDIDYGNFYFGSTTDTWNTRIRVLNRDPLGCDSFYWTYSITSVAPERVLVGDSLGVNFNVENCPGHTTTARTEAIYMATHVPTSTDTLVGQVSLEPKKGGQSFSVTTAGLAPGTYWLGTSSHYNAHSIEIVNPDITCSDPCTVQFDWGENPETLVNQSGGGYKIYYDSASGGESYSVDVPYVSGSSSPTTGQVTFPGTGIWYIHIRGYSSINPGGQSSVDSIVEVQ